MRNAWVWVAMLAWGRSAVADAPSNLVLDGVPEPTPEWRAAVAPYLEFRPSTFLDWHPRRRDVLIATRLAETPQLHAVRSPLGPRMPLTTLSDRVSGGSYAPGMGDMIVFSQDRGGDERHQLFRLDLPGGGITRLTDGTSRNTDVSWARSGTWLTYASTRRNGRDTDLYGMDPSRPETDRLLTEVQGGGWAPVDVSPDGQRLLAVSMTSANASSLYLIEVGNGQRRRVTSEDSGPVSITDAAFLADGRTALVMTDQGSEHRRLRRVDLETGRTEPFGPEIPWGADEFELSADGQKVAMLTNEDGVSVLRWLDAATGVEAGRAKLPKGVVSGIRWHPTRQEIGMTLSSARSPGDVFSVETRMNGLTRWTSGATGRLKASRFVEPEVVTVTSFDGLSVSGLLYRPDSRKFPGRRPVVVHFHGGPEGQSRPQFLRAWNFLLDELGMALLYPNVRGSEGYGKRFLTLDDGIRREDSVSDVGAFLDWIGRQPSLDADKVAVYGGSYGGYLVLASMIRFGDRLRCGIDVVGISDFRTFLQNTDDYRRDLRRAEYGDERDPAMAEFLQRISPLSQASRIRKPLLVVQGKNDPRVPVTEAEQLVRTIRDQGGTVGYLLANDEGHGFVKKANADFLFLTIVQFLKAHLIE